MLVDFALEAVYKGELPGGDVDDAKEVSSGDTAGSRLLFKMGKLVSGGDNFAALAARAAGKAVEVVGISIGPRIPFPVPVVGPPCGGLYSSEAVAAAGCCSSFC